MNRKMNLSLALVLAAALSASPALAQKGHGNGNKGGKHNDRVERRDDRGGRTQVRRDDRRDDGVVLQRRTTNTVRTGRRQGVPPGWCIGRGNPHNTVANCGYGSGRYDARYDDRIYTGGGRYDVDSDRYGGSYAQRHAEYHSWHDRECRELSSRRPLDLAYQIRVRAECKAEHDAWHRQTGTRH